MMSGEGYRTLRQCWERSQILQARGFTFGQITDVLALDHQVSPLRLYRYAHGLTAKAVCDHFNQLDPAATAGLREARLYDYETWPETGRRSPAWALTLLARIYQTNARQLLTDEVYATYRPTDRDVIDAADHRHLDVQQPRHQPDTKTGPTRASMEESKHTEPSLIAVSDGVALTPRACEDLFQAVCVQEADVKRRNVLFQLALALGGPPALALLRHLTPGESERLAYAIRAPGSLDGQAVSAIEKLTARCWQLDETIGPRKLLPLADAKRGIVIRQLQHASLSPKLRERLLGVSWDLAHLAGWAHYDLLDYQGATRRYTDGLETAHELQDPTRLAHMHGCLANMAVYRQQPTKALDHAFAAQGWAKDSPSNLQKAATSLVVARVLATARTTLASLRTLNQAATHAARARTDADPPHLFWCTPSRIYRHEVFCLAAMKRTDEAIAAGGRLLEQLPTPLVRHRAEIMLEMSASLVSNREIPAAAVNIAQAAKATTAHSSARLAQSVRVARNALTPWARTSDVRDLDEQLRALGLGA